LFWKEFCHLGKSEGAISMFTFDRNKIGKIFEWKWNNSKSKTEFEKRSWEHPLPFFTSECYRDLNPSRLNWRRKSLSQKGFTISMCLSFRIIFIVLMVVLLQWILTTTLKQKFYDYHVDLSKLVFGAISHRAKVHYPRIP